MAPTISDVIRNSEQALAESRELIQRISKFERNARIGLERGPSEKVDSGTGQSERRITAIAAPPEALVTERPVVLPPSAMEHNMWPNSYIQDEIARADRRIAATRTNIANLEQRLALELMQGENATSSWEVRNIFLSLLETRECHRTWLLRRL